MRGRGGLARPSAILVSGARARSAVGGRGSDTAPETRWVERIEQVIAQSAAGAGRRAPHHRRRSQAEAAPCMNR
jgi:hypothetical protein